MVIRVIRILYFAIRSICDVANVWTPEFESFEFLIEYYISLVKYNALDVLCQLSRSIMDPWLRVFDDNDLEPKNVMF